MFTNQKVIGATLVLFIIGAVSYFTYSKFKQEVDTVIPTPQPSSSPALEFVFNKSPAPVAQPQPQQTQPQPQLFDSSSTSLTAGAQDVASLRLTPPDILLYTGSATLANLTVHSEATMSGQLTAYQAEIQDHFKVLGTSTLANTQVVGDLTIDGTLSIENGNQINVIGFTPGVEKCAYTPGVECPGVLYLQKSILAQGVDILSGKVTIDKDGTLKAVSLIADQFKINEGQSAGVGLIPAGVTEVVVENPYVSESSLILVTAHTPLIQTLGVTERKAKSEATAANFKIKLAHPEPLDINFDYLIIGINKPTPAPLSQRSQ